MTAITAAMFPGTFRLRNPATGRSIEVRAGDVDALTHHVRVAVGDRELDPFWMEAGKVTEGTHLLLVVDGPIGRRSRRHRRSTR